MLIPLVDIHCHLLAGVDDGPKTDADALEMCRIACDEGIRLASALAHQNEEWNAVTPSVIREAARKLTSVLRAAELPITVFPSAEVMVRPDILADWQRGDLLSVADRGKYLLVEMPHGLFIDLRGIIRSFQEIGVCLILAHPERQPELLHDPGRIEQFIQAGCLVQVSSGSITNTKTREDARALQDWFKRGIVHFLGSDGHSPHRRRPQMAAAYRQITRWAGVHVADRVCSTNATAIVHGLPLRVPPPEARRRGWFSRFW